MSSGLLDSVTTVLGDSLADLQKLESNGIGYYVNTENASLNSTLVTEFIKAMANNRDESSQANV